MKRPDTSREDQARRDLERMDREQEMLFRSTPTAANDDNDPAVIMGKRVARILSPLIALGLIAYLYATYLT